MCTNLHKRLISIQVSSNKLLLYSFEQITKTTRINNNNLLVKPIFKYANYKSDLIPN